MIVDNGSSNNSGKLIDSKYKDKNNIHVILLKDNLGFAKGNNIGFQYAKKELNCDFICMLNNDTILSQNTFIDKCYEIYQHHSYAVIGPMIIRKDNTIQPLIKTIRSRKFYILYRNFIRLELFMSYLGFNTAKITNFIVHILQIFRRSNQIHEGADYENSQTNIRLHGCCWIFTPQFVNKFQGINNKTFLYREEELLYILLCKNNFESIYTPELRIHHLEDVSTDMIVNTPKKKREFIYRNEIASLKILINEMKA